MIRRLLWFMLIWIPATVSGQEFPYPDVPDSLQSPESRMDYLLDREKKVLQKDASPQTILQNLSELLKNE